MALSLSSAFDGGRSENEELRRMSSIINNSVSLEINQFALLCSIDPGIPTDVFSSTD